MLPVKHSRYVHPSFLTMQDVKNQLSRPCQSTILFLVHFVKPFAILLSLWLSSWLFKPYYVMYNMVLLCEHPFMPDLQPSSSKYCNRSIQFVFVDISLEDPTSHFYLSRDISTSYLSQMVFICMNSPSV